MYIIMNLENDCSSKTMHYADETVNSKLTQESNLEETVGECENLSKRQRKKQLKRKLWLEKLPAKRAKEKEKRKLKKLAAVTNNSIAGLPSSKALKNKTMAKSNCKVRIAIDMAFDDIMTDKDICKCVKQILRCYSVNRRIENPTQFYVTSFVGKCKSEMAKHSGYENWDVYFKNDPYYKVFDDKDIVYLTSDSENVLTELDDEKVFVIGGLVDHNSQKGLTLQLANRRGIRHAQLPLAEYLNMKTRKVLSFVHVFEILVLVSQGISWKDAFLRVLPLRKGATEKMNEITCESDITDLSLVCETSNEPDV